MQPALVLRRNRFVPPALAVAATGLSVGLFCGTSDRAQVRADAVARAPIRTRMSIPEFVKDPARVKALQDGVRAMMQLPAENPYSWIFQADIHARPDWPDFVSEAGNDPVADFDHRLLRENKAFQPPHDVFGKCPHHNWWFFPWHRAYLYYFERILRHQAQDDSLCLPYWNYYEADQRTLPILFRNVPAADGGRNPLYVADQVRVVDSNNQQWTIPLRSHDMNALGKSLDDPFVSYGDDNNGLTRRTWYTKTGVSTLTFGGAFAQNLGDHPGASAIENVPHDQIHDALGGDETRVVLNGRTWVIQGLMGHVPYAARDPVFWSHHANIDRIWEVWRKLGGKEPTDLTNPDQAAWLTKEYKFYDVGPAPDFAPIPVTLTTRDLMNMDLGYVYDDLTPPSGGVQLKAEATVDGEDHGESRVLASKPADAPAIQLRTRQPETVRLGVAQAAIQELPAGGVQGKSGRVLLKIEGVERGKKRPGGLYYDVYVNQPRGEKPDRNGPHWAGIVSFFGLDVGHGERHGPNDVDLPPMDVTRAFESEKLIRQARNEVTVTFVPRFGLSPAPKEPPDDIILTVKGVRLIYEAAGQ